MSMPNEKKYLAHYRVTIDFGLCLADKADAMRRLNVHYTGRAQVADVVAITTDLRESHEAMHRVRQMTMDVGLRPDGVLEPVMMTDDDDDHDRGSWWCTWKEYDDQLQNR